jgi:GNAT superfamily N-acetyltransferase
MAKPEIREALSADAIAMADLAERLARKHLLRDCCSPSGRNALLDSIAPHALVANMDAGCVYHLATTGGEVFGMIGLRNASHVLQLFVADALHGTGLGRRLWEAGRDSACLQGTAPPIFTATAVPSAAGFYRALGFLPSGPDEERNGIRMLPMRYVMLAPAARR